MPTLLFDLDGTLLDVRARHYEVYADLARNLGIEPLPEPTVWRRRRAGSSAVGLLPDPSPSARDEFVRGWLEGIESPRHLALDRPHRGASRALEALGRGYRLVLVTLRNHRDALEAQLKATELDKFFEAVYTPPAPSVRRKSLVWRANGATDPMVVIGDSEADIEFATDLGTDGIFVTYGMRSSTFLRKQGALRLSDSCAGVTKTLRRDGC